MLVLVLLIIVVAIVYWLFMSSYSQIFGPFPYQAKTKEKVVALTFDDGPNEPYTSEIVDFLNTKNVKATFFMVGKCVQRFPDTAVKVFKSGHVVGNHSLSHQFHKGLLHPDFKNEILATQKIIEAQIGQKPALFRPPWLWRQPLLFKTLRRLGLKPISGQFGHELEPFQAAAERIARRALTKVRPGAILIFHDGRDGHGGNRSQTVAAIKIVVEELLKRGYKFVTVDQLLQVLAYF